MDFVPSSPLLDSTALNRDYHSRQPVAKTLPIGMKIHKTARGGSVEQIDHLMVV